MVERGKRKVRNQFYAILWHVVCSNIKYEGENE